MIYFQTSDRKSINEPQKFKSNKRLNHQRRPQNDLFNARKRTQTNPAGSAEKSYVP